MVAVPESGLGITTDALGNISALCSATARTK